MFVIKTIPDVTVPVDIHVPGEASASRIYATWKLHAFDAAQKTIHAIKSSEITDIQLVDDDLINITELSDEKGQTVAYTPEVAKQLLQMTYVRQPLINSWFAAQQGHSEAAVKN